MTEGTACRLSPLLESSFLGSTFVTLPSRLCVFIRPLSELVGPAKTHRRLADNIVIICIHVFFSTITQAAKLMTFLVSVFQIMCGSHKKEKVFALRSEH